MKRRSSSSRVWSTTSPTADLELALRLARPGDGADHRAGPFPVALDTAALRARSNSAGAYGAALSAMLFADPGAATAFAEMRVVGLSASQRLRLRLSLPPALHALRWELLTDPRSGRVLAVDGDLLLSRYLAADDFQPVQLRPRGELRALIAVAGPTDAGDYGLAPIDAAVEAGRVQAALGSVPTTVISATWEALSDALRAGYDVLYPSMAHGVLQGSQPWLWLVDDQGNADWRRGGALADLLRSLGERRPRLVVLASCEGAGDGYADMLAALGPLLAQAGVLAVVAMQGKLSFTTNERLAPVLFGELLVDGLIDRAVNAARLSVADDRPDWWLPVQGTPGKLRQSPVAPAVKSVVERRAAQPASASCGTDQGGVTPSLPPAARPVPTG